MTISSTAISKENARVLMQIADAELHGAAKHFYFNSPTFVRFIETELRKARDAAKWTQLSDCVKDVAVERFRAYYRAFNHMEKCLQFTLNCLDRFAAGKTRDSPFYLVCHVVETNNPFERPESFHVAVEATEFLHRFCEHWLVKHRETLKHLRLGACESANTYPLSFQSPCPLLFRAIQESNLVSLNMHGFCFTDQKGVVRLCDALPWTLEVLDLSNCKLSNKDVVYMSHRLRNLRDLNIAWSWVYTSGLIALASQLATSKIRKLNISFGKFTAEGFNFVCAAIAAIPSQLRYNKLCNDLQGKLTSQVVQEQQRFNLECNGMFFSSCQGPIKVFPFSSPAFVLTELNLGSCRLDDDAMVDLCCGLESNLLLERLLLGDNFFSDLAILHLANKIRFHPRLSMVYVGERLLGEASQFLAQQMEIMTSQRMGVLVALYSPMRIPRFGSRSPFKLWFPKELLRMLIGFL